MPLDFALPPPLTLEQCGSSEQSAKQDAESSSTVKKGQPWSEAEHLQFLAGLKKLGKGNWRGISKYFCTGRSPTQVASHAQKHFLRVHGHCKRKSRFSSLEKAACAQGLLSTPVSIPTAAVHCSWTYPFVGVPAYSTAALLQSAVAPSATLSPHYAISSGCYLPEAVVGSSTACSSLPIAPLSTSCPIADTPLPALRFAEICRPQASYALGTSDTQRLQQGLCDSSQCTAAGPLQLSDQSAFRSLDASPAPCGTA